jgi:hypothetical protein
VIETSHSASEERFRTRIHASLSDDNLNRYEYSASRGRTRRAWIDPDVSTICSTIDDRLHERIVDIKYITAIREHDIGTRARNIIGASRASRVTWYQGYI